MTLPLPVIAVPREAHDALIAKLRRVLAMPVIGWRDIDELRTALALYDLARRPQPRRPT